MKVLFIKNTPAEGPGTMEEYLKSRGVPFSIIDLSLGEVLPTIESFTHLVVLGGPMAVYEMYLYPYLREEARFIERAAESGKAILGVCLGSQMLAHVLGAKVYAGPEKEIGWYEVALTDDGMKDRCMATLSIDGRNRAEVFQWHGDTFDLPTGAARLASSEIYPNQAFRYGERMYGLQFHIEATPRIVTGWLEKENGIPLSTIASDSDRIYPRYRVRADGFYSRFFV